MHTSGWNAARDHTTPRTAVDLLPQRAERSDGEATAKRRRSDGEATAQRRRRMTLGRCSRWGRGPPGGGAGAIGWMFRRGRVPEDHGRDDARAVTVTSHNDRAAT